VKLDGAQAGRCLFFFFSFPFFLFVWILGFILLIYLFLCLLLLLLFFCVDWDGFFPKKVFCAVDVELMLS